MSLVTVGWLNRKWEWYELSIYIKSIATIGLFCKSKQNTFVKYFRGFQLISFNIKVFTLKILHRHKEDTPLLNCDESYMITNSVQRNQR